MGDSETPPPPDYVGAAQTTAAGNADAARVAANANRVNQYGPGGSIEYNQRDPSNPDLWNVTTKLSPQQQALYDLKGQTDVGLGNLALTGVNKAQGLLSDPTVDTSGLPSYISSVNGSDAARNQAIDASYSQSTRFLDPQMARSEEALRTQLLNQGFGGAAQGNEGFKNAMQDFNANKTNVYGDARDRAIAAGDQQFQQSFGRDLQNATLANANRGQQIGERAYLQDRPLNLISALRSGTQVQGPQFQNVPQQATTMGPDYNAATANRATSQNNLYNAQVGRQNAMTSGLFDLGASGLQTWGNG